MSAGYYTPQAGGAPQSIQYPHQQMAQPDPVNQAAYVQGQTGMGYDPQQGPPPGYNPGPQPGYAYEPYQPKPIEIRADPGFTRATGGHALPGLVHRHEGHEIKDIFKGIAIGWLLGIATTVAAIWWLLSRFGIIPR